MIRPWSAQVLVVLLILWGGLTILTHPDKQKVTWRGRGRQPRSFRTIAAARQNEMKESIAVVATTTFIERFARG